MSIDHYQLRLFIDVATFRSINKASEHRNIAQPALSRRMRQLEYDLDADLFIRSPQGIALTNAGHRLLMRATALIRQFDALRELSTEEVVPGHHLRIGMPPGVSLMLLDQVVNEVYRQIDGVILTVEEEDSNILIQQVLDGRIDIAVVSRCPVPESLAVHPYFSEPLFFATHASRAPGHDLPFAVPDADQAFFDIAGKALKALGRPNQIDMRLASIASIKRLVEIGQASTLGPYSAFTRELAGADWRFERVSEPLLMRDIVWRKEDDQTENVVRSRKILQEVIVRCAAQARDDTLTLLSAP